MLRSWKATLIGVALIGSFAWQSAAHAGDLPGQRQASTPAFATNWAGFYAGAHASYGFGRSRAADINGFAGGLQGGYAFQNDRLVYGGELDIAYAGIDTRGFTETFRQKWFGPCPARLCV